MKPPFPMKPSCPSFPRLSAPAAWLFVSGLTISAGLLAPTRLEAVSYTVSGNHILKDGAVWQIHGVARASYEWSPTGDGHFTQTDMNTIAGWNANTVRIAFNESYMLSDSSCYDPNYLGRLDAAVTAANTAGMNVIFDLHWNTANTTGCATGQQNMADRRSLTAWTTMANRYKTNSTVFFELYNEPHDITWSVWRNGNSTWAGMQEMYDTVRNNGFNNLVLIGGLNWAYDLSGVPANRVTGNNIVYVTHPYDFGGKQPADWPTGFGFLTATDPVAATEFGAFNCTTSYVVSALNYYDAPEGDTNRRMSWTGWAWNEPNSCGFPSIISDWTGGASTMGQPEKDRLLGYGNPPPSPPPAPTGLSATPGDTQVSLSWSASSGATSYNVKRSTTSGGPYTTVGSPTSTSFTNTGLTNGTTYYYVVSAVNSAGESANSSEVSATPQPSAPPLAPTGLSASSGPGKRKISLSWTQSTSPGITGNNVYRSTTNGGPYSLVANLNAVTSYTNSGLTSGTTYYYVVTAVSAGGESAYSNQGSATAN